MTEPCPCGSDSPYAVCCGPYVTDGLPAPTAEALMRSRYTAYARGDVDHLFRTWHARTRPPDVVPDPAIRWTGLSILDVTAGGASDEEGWVEFIARWRSDSQHGELRERSHFTRRAGRWVYVGAEVG